MSRRSDVFGPKIAKIGAILAIFVRLKIFVFFFRRWCPVGGVSGSGESCSRLFIDTV